MTHFQPIYVEIGKGLYRMVGLPMIATWDTKSRPKKAKYGTIGFNSQTKSIEYFNGTDWLEAKMA
jgi:hypothetical protein